MKKITIMILTLMFMGCSDYVDNHETKKTPIQEKVNTEKVNYAGYEIRKEYSYDITARVLHKKEYEDELTISKFDMALGWNEMSKMEHINTMDIWQRNRWYYWFTTSESTLNRRQIVHNSANVHLVAINEDIEKQLSEIDQYDIVEFKGYLVNIDKGKEKWRTSTSRSDKGGGACEVMMVESVNIKEKRL